MYVPLAILIMFYRLGDRLLMNSWKTVFSKSTGTEKCTTTGF